MREPERPLIRDLVAPSFPHGAVGSSVHADVLGAIACSVRRLTPVHAREARRHRSRPRIDGFFLPAICDDAVPAFEFVCYTRRLTQHLAGGRFNVYSPGVL